MYYTEQPQQLLERLMKHASDHFRIDTGLRAIIISYNGKECEVFSEKIEPIYLQAFQKYEEEMNCYQEALQQYEVIEQAYLLNQSVTAEELAKHQQLVQEATPREHELWYKEVILDIINQDKENFGKAMETILTN